MTGSGTGSSKPEWRSERDSNLSRFTGVSTARARRRNPERAERAEGPLSAQSPGRVWRRERDSNPRYPFGYSGFQDHPFRPLTHPSTARTHTDLVYRENPEEPSCARDAATDGELRCPHGASGPTRWWEKAKEGHAEIQRGPFKLPSLFCCIVLRRGRGGRCSSDFVRGLRIDLHRGEDRFQPPENFLAIHGH